MKTPIERMEMINAIELMRVLGYVPRYVILEPSCDDLDLGDILLE